MYLITTPIEKNSTNNETTRILLGEWCNIYKHPVYKKKNSDLILDYHWSNFNKLENDSEIIFKLYNNILIELSNDLNKIFKKNLNKKSYELIMGYWLIQFIAVVFDRYSNLLNAYKYDSNLKLINFSNLKLKLISNNSGNSGRLFANDFWNYVLYIKISKLSKLINFKIDSFVLDKKLLEESEEDISVNYKLKKNKYKNYLKSIIGNITHFFSKSNNVFLYNALPLKYHIKLYKKFKSFPTLNWIQNSFNFHEDKKLRENILSTNQKEADDFQNILKILIKLCLPKIYLEGFNLVYEYVDQLKLPKNPKIIFTNNSHFKDDLFKFWSAKKIEKNSKLLISQHGGGPFYKFSGANYFETRVADLYLCSGIGNSIKKNIKAMFSNLNYKIDEKSYDKKGIALYALVTLPRYSTDLRSAPLSTNMIDYFDFNYKFYLNLNKEIKKNLYVRVYPKGDYDWMQKERWKDKFRDVKLDLCQSTMEKMIQKSRIFISSYDATTYNQTLSANIPTLMCWDPKLWKTIENSKSIFSDLKKNQIFHDTPTSASKFINTIWDNIEEWWNSKEVQNTRNNYCELFAYRVNKELDILTNIFEEQINNKYK